MIERILNQAGHRVAGLYGKSLLSMDVEWQAPLPGGPKIIAANHPSTTDPFLLMGLIGEPMSILITEACFKLPGLGAFLRTAGHVPVVSGSGKAALDEGVRLLRAGQTVGIFPEGALSPLAQLGCGGCAPAHTGVARLALRHRRAGDPGGHQPGPGADHLQGYPDRRCDGARSLVLSRPVLRHRRQADSCDRQPGGSGRRADGRRTDHGSHRGPGAAERLAPAHRGRAARCIDSDPRLWAGLRSRFSHACQIATGSSCGKREGSKSTPWEKTAQAQVRILCAAATKARRLALPRLTKRR